MKKSLIMFMVFSLATAGMVGGALAGDTFFKLEKVTIKGVEVEAVKMADNFIILFDASSSMSKKYKDTDMASIDAAIQILKQANASLPNLSWNAALYRFTGRDLPKKMFAPYYEMQPYNKEAFAKAIDQLPHEPSGPTMLQSALYRLGSVLKDLKGQTIVYIFTDGTYSHTQGQDKPLKLAKALAEKYNVCFYLISSAKGETETKLLKAVAEINDCSRVVPFDFMMDKPEYTTGALYVIRENLIFKTKVVGARIDDILFDFDKTDIKPEFQKELDKFGKFMQKTPKAYAIVAGFTDSTGSEGHNLILSRKRAQSVKAYLVQKFAVAEDRIIIHGYGIAYPADSNNTDEGRMKNRRVSCVTVVKK